MATAAEILQVAGPAVSRRLILQAGIPTERGKYQEHWVKRSAVEDLARRRGGRVGPGRKKRIPEIIAMGS